MSPTAGRMAENSKVKRKSGRRNPAGLLSFMSRSGKESSKETVFEILNFINIDHTISI